MVRAETQILPAGFPDRMAREPLCRCRIRVRSGAAWPKSWMEILRREAVETVPLVDELQRVSVAIAEIARINALQRHGGKEFLPAGVGHRADALGRRLTR